MRAVTSDEFLIHLRQSDLVPLGALSAWLEAHAASEEPPDQLADRLVAAGFLTSFQAERLLKGRPGELTIGGKYKVLDPLGKGGMGAVYLCEHRALRTLVAVKVLPASADEKPNDRERFYREARAFATLSHPNLVRGFDVDTDGTVHFIVMEYVDGVDLQALVDRFGPLRIERAVNYVRQAACGLGYAHDQGWVHRDIKPANIAVDRTGLVRVLDMGLARAIFEGSDGITRNYDDGAVRGTADYLSPEQAGGSPVDGRSDFYSLGVTLYFLLTGKLPFGELTTAQKLVAHLLKTPPSVRRWRPELPEKLAQVVEKLMAKEPANRYQTGAEVMDALAPWDRDSFPPAEEEIPRRLPAGVLPATAPLGGSGARTPMPNRSGSGTKTSRKKKPLWVVAGLVGVIALVAGLVAVAILTRPAERDGGPPPVVPSESPFTGNYVPVTRAHGPNQVPFPGGHSEYLQGRVYTSVAEALADPRLRELDNCRILLLDLVHEEQLALDATKLPHGIVIESARTDPPTEWLPPERARADPTRPLLSVSGGSVIVRNLTFNGLGQIDVPVSWTDPGPGAQLHAVRVTQFTRTGVLIRNPAGTALDPVQLSRVRVHPDSKTQVDACVTVAAVRGPARHLRLTECRLEGTAGDGLSVTGGIEGLEVTRCRLFELLNGVRLTAPTKLAATLTGNTTARVAAPVRVDALPPAEDKNRRLTLRSNLFSAEAAVAVRFGEQVTGSAELFRGSDANWCDADGCRTPTAGLTISRAPVLGVKLDPGNDAEFLRYPATSPLATAGPDRQPVGVPPG